jgi:hypothetical protein
MNIILKWLAEMRAIFYALDRTIEKKGDFLYVQMNVHWMRYNHNESKKSK